ncbi:hypothetical protein NY08_3566 [Rhodococcus sp. B7740]|uniref:hypothetical protein n=1 Tax=Rhodococcus sp. B7740 TaxID=1564114 RepID=UPI0005D8CB41|nr:hypothetical protein [Rhodococcus sp. B7740]AJW41576.1 hypothetical protein NY08_3566 [Rhodococcus sp. B7740]
MSRTSGIRRNLVRRSVAVALATGACALAVPAAAVAQPELGPIVDSGSAIVDSGSAILDGGNIIDNGARILGSGSAIAGGILGIDTGSANGGIATQQCNASTMSGEEGVTETLHELGRTGPTSFVLSYDTVDVPDQIEVFYQGALIHNTGYVGGSTGVGSVVVSVPPGTASAVLVRVTGPVGTVWTYTVSCPA